jgi:glutathione reductase (NADPH)
MNANRDSNLKYDYDLITLGAGSGGVAASRRAAAHGARVAVIEGSRVGGTCVIRGCVPKKLMMYAAQYGDALREAEGYGWSIGASHFDMRRWAAAKAAETARLEGVYRQLLATSGVELIEGWARVVEPHHVAVGERTLTARHLLIATGAAPVRDSIPGIEHCAVSDDLLDLTDLPECAAVIGSGFIAIEFASIMARLGVRVSLFYRSEWPLRGFDDDLRRRAAAALREAGIALHPGAAPNRVVRDGRNLRLEFADGEAHTFAFVLNATGRRPNTAKLGLETLGIALGANGAVPVDARRHTSARGVYAIGDVTDHMNLTPVAIAEGRALADALFSGSTREVDLSLVSSAVFMLPPIATIGPTEAEAAQAGHALKIFESDFRPMRQTFFGGHERSYMKLLVDAKDDRVLGIHMLGADAPEIVQSLAVALACGATKAQFDRTIALHPTAAEEFVLMREPARTVAAQGAD